MAKLKDVLSGKLTKKEISLVPASFDVVGDIAIFSKFPDKLNKKSKIIGDALMQLNKHIKVVAVKSGKYSGRLRTPKLKIIAGEKRRETLHRENGISLRLDVEKCYFSPRSSTERLRIARLVKPNENVLVLFSGVGPYPCVISKNSKAKEITGIELNKTANKYALENVKTNKIKNVRLLQGDAKRLIPKINEKFDRIVMPLPKSAEKYLDIALKILKRNGTIHLYIFSEEDKFNEIINKYKRRFNYIKLIKCGVYSPRVYRVCLDLRI